LRTPDYFANSGGTLGGAGGFAANWFVKKFLTRWIGNSHAHRSGMAQPASQDPRIARDAARLEEFLRDLPGESGTPAAALREHLEAARFYLLGSMPHECGLSLELAQHLLPEVEDSDLKSRIAEFLRSSRGPDGTDINSRPPAA
jgi:hypothetical protein